MPLGNPSTGHRRNASGGAEYAREAVEHVDRGVDERSTALLVVPGGVHGVEHTLAVPGRLEFVIPSGGAAPCPVHLPECTFVYKLLHLAYCGCEHLTGRGSKNEITLASGLDH